MFVAWRERLPILLFDSTRRKQIVINHTLVFQFVPILFWLAPYVIKAVRDQKYFLSIADIVPYLTRDWRCRNTAEREKVAVCLWYVSCVVAVSSVPCNSDGLDGALCTTGQRLGRLFFGPENRSLRAFYYMQAVIKPN